MSDWPNYNDYTTSIQTPGLCFRDAELRRSSVEKHPLTRMPKVWTGNFAQVYALTDSNRRWAVKCFTRSSVDIRQRYATISALITSIGLPYFSEFTLLDDEMLVSGRRYPILKMRWVNGQTLDKFVEANLYQPKALLEIVSGLIRMVKD